MTQLLPGLSLIRLFFVGSFYWIGIHSNSFMVSLLAYRLLGTHALLLFLVYCLGLALVSEDILPPSRY